MPTYEYECHGCHRAFAVEQRMSDPALTECSECHGQLQRLISGGGGLFIKGDGGGAGAHSLRSASGCALEQTGSTCCGRARRCDKPPCGSRG